MPFIKNKKNKTGSDESDPELEAEKEYEKEFGTKKPAVSEGAEKGDEAKTGDGADQEKPVINYKEPKAVRKARSRGVSGSSIKKDGGRFEFGLDDWDDYDDVSDVSDDDLSDNIRSMDERSACGNDGDGHQERLQLIPRECTTAVDGTQHFQAVFEARYHHPAPVFVGSLQEAIAEAFEGPEGRKAKEQRPLALYIHHDGSLNRDRFPKEVLCSYQVLGMLRTQFLVWPWDVSHEENEERLANWMSECGLGEALSTVSSFFSQPDRFPLLLLFSRYNGELQMIDFVGGSDTAAQAREKLTACTRAQVFAHNFPDVTV